MKKVYWLIAKIAFVSLSLIFIYSFDLYDVSAQDTKKCNTSQACTGTIYCTCGDSDCGGCYIPNGAGGCGTCASRSTDLEF